MKYKVYIVRCADRTLYTGVTNDLERRLEAHNAGKGAKCLRGKRPVKLVYAKKYPSLGRALSAEIKIKKLTRDKKIEMIKSKKAIQTI